MSSPTSSTSTIHARGTAGISPPRLRISRPGPGGTLAGHACASSLSDINKTATTVNDGQGNSDESPREGLISPARFKRYVKRLASGNFIKHPQKQLRKLSMTGHWKTRQAQRVLIYSPVFPPNISFGGGVAITYFALAKRLSERGGTSVRVYSPRAGNMDACSTFTYPDFLFSIPSLQNLLRLWKEISWCDVIVAPEGICTAYINFMARIQRKPVLYNIHTDVRAVLVAAKQMLIAQLGVEWWVLGLRLTSCSALFCTA